MVFTEGTGFRVSGLESSYPDSKENTRPTDGVKMDEVLTLRLPRQLVNILLFLPSNTKQEYFMIEGWKLTQWNNKILQQE